MDKNIRQELTAIDIPPEDFEMAFPAAHQAIVNTMHLTKISANNQPSGDRAMAIAIDTETVATNEDSSEFAPPGAGSVDTGHNEDTANVVMDDWPVDGTPDPVIDPTVEDESVDGGDTMNPDVEEKVADNTVDDIDADGPGIDPTNEEKLAENDNVIPQPTPVEHEEDEGGLENRDDNNGGTGGIEIPHDDIDHHLANVIGKTDINSIDTPIDPANKINGDGLNDIAFDQEHVAEQLQGMVDEAESIRDQIQQAIESAQGLLGDAESKVADAESVLQRIKDAESSRSYA